MTKVVTKIKLKGGAEVEAFLDYPAKCRGCGTKIFFAVTAEEKVMPIRKVGTEWQSHFADCPAAAEFRKDKK